MIVIPDMQVPYHDKKTMKVVEDFMADHTWDYYLNIGDFMDFDSISTHSRGKLRQIEGKRVLKDYEIGNQILDRHQGIVRKNNKDAQFILLEGNHEYRIERYLEELPQLAGMLEVEKGLNLEERGFEWVRCYEKGQDFQLGKAHFHHGIYTSTHHAKKHVQTWGTNIFYGHLHDTQQYSLSRKGVNDTVVGQSLGCLCEYNQQYMKGRPSNWQQAFAVFYFQPNGYFTYNIIRIFNHKFIANGKLYE